MVGNLNEIELSAQLAPRQIVDDGGIPLSVHHLAFVGCSAQSLADWRARRAPLGMNPETYRDFCRSLFVAAGQDGLADIDTRLKGSSAVLYSGYHKILPRKLMDLVNEFRKEYRRPASTTEQLVIEEKLDEFCAGQSWPRRRPFDSMHRLTVHPEPSDYDIQISSGMAEQRCLRIRARLPDDDDVDPGISIHHPKYGFIEDRFASLAIPRIWAWANRWTIDLKRTVAVKLFGSKGPDNLTKTIGELSSHFRASDWLLRRHQPGD